MEVQCLLQKFTPCCIARDLGVLHIKIFIFKDVRGWKFLTMKAAETLCVVAYHQRKIFPEKHICVTDLQIQFLS